MGALLTPRKLALDKGEPKARTDYEDRFERTRLAVSENYCDTMEIQPSVRVLRATGEYQAGCSKSSSSKAAADGSTGGVASGLR
jgi:hypothetical protein